MITSNSCPAGQSPGQLFCPIPDCYLWLSLQFLSIKYLVVSNNFFVAQEVPLKQQLGIGQISIITSVVFIDLVVSNNFFVVQEVLLKQQLGMGQIVLKQFAELQRERECVCVCVCVSHLFLDQQQWRYFNLHNALECLNWPDFFYKGLILQRWQVSTCDSLVYLVPIKNSVIISC